MRTLTRLEMYELAWSEPMQSLAKKFSLSDRGLAKICASASHPRPCPRPQGEARGREDGRTLAAVGPRARAEGLAAEEQVELLQALSCPTLGRLVERQPYGASPDEPDSFEEIRHLANMWPLMWAACSNAPDPASNPPGRPNPDTREL